MCYKALMTLMTQKRSWASVLALAAVLSAPALARAQAPIDPREAQPERPTVATHAYPVARGFLELEAGYMQQPRPGTARLMTTPILFKVGIAPRMQLDVSPGWLQVSDQGVRKGGIGDLGLALKWQLTENAPIIGSFAIQPSVTLATGSVENGTSAGRAAVGILLISSYQFGRVALDLNAAYTHRGGDGTIAPKDATAWTISTWTLVYERLGWCAELFGFPGTHGPAGDETSVGFLFGPTFDVDKSLVIDAGIVFDVKGLGGNQVYAGATWNIGRIFGR